VDGGVDGTKAANVLPAEAPRRITIIKNKPLGVSLIIIYGNIWLSYNFE
jgi:hypothetical protein